MITCPTCGVQNDPGNRFCDQCGTRIDTPPAPTPGFVPPDQPTVAAPNCPNCGSTVLPGEAFCDNCGADLTALAVPTAAPVLADAPTMLATPPTAAPPAAPSVSGGETRCPSCGQANLPGEAFCDNCGASLTAPAATPPPPLPVSPDDATILATPPIVPTSPPVPDNMPTLQPNDATMIANTPIVVPEPTPAPPTPEPIVVPEPAPEPIVVPEPAPEPIPAPPAPEPIPAPPAPTASANPAGDATRKAEIEAEIARQQQIISQFEQMQAMFGAAAPPAVTAGLAEARTSMAKAQADLAALAAPTPTVDPELVKQHEAEIARQQQIISQFEQMQAMFGAAAPPAVTAGLSEAQAALAKAEADLAALTGDAPPPAASTPPAIPTAAAPPPPPAPPAPRPHLVIADGGQTLNLPIDRAEIIVGREDPVSNIFPEIDLTSFGGEAGGVSRQHAKIIHNNGQWKITDLNSTNFTRVDGVRLEPYVETMLHDGARIQFGRVVATFKM
ncbi:MAG: FHA domain-containing protein [Oscillochloris sp.]|nr:FHA domain-containing protein [Oscillochloris sp.]